MNDLFEGYIMILTQKLERSKKRNKVLNTSLSIREINDSIKYLKSAQEAYNKGDTNVSLEYIEMIPTWLQEGNWHTLRSELQ